MQGFIVIIGSVARNDFSTSSDIDICRIDCDIQIARKSNWPDGPINIIDYDRNTFNHLFNINSLFIYHILFEGVLIYGDIDEWVKLKSSFILKKNFVEEINDTKELISIFKNIEMFGEHFTSLYSNFFISLKNFSIFYLANKGIYTFNKEQAIKKVFGNYHFNILFDSFNYFERGLSNENLTFSNKEEANDIIQFYLLKMEELS
ncbi:hypothetical protein B1A99_34940 [Cohnella sp. CIP 111063]|uniref:hypothetical protein n=1 Tax=unclassified Cohnella TaxID=2636738 RepID=UPI000B8C17F0|nr:MULTISPECIES: hypothetical protein [unclassified Cohnella]OXS52156.1 hypothetical protein B1A99_34940 [Cohnella sp. CIP 111063]PRX53401.1 hypothetical protein B0G52_1455 [Cohnella sp. SGD-V74]